MNDPYILTALVFEPLSGYDITQRVVQFTEGRVEIKTSMISPTLSSLKI